MKKLLMFLCAITLIFGMVGSASANLLTNGDFETGDLTGWETKGDVSVVVANCLADVQGMDNNFALLGLGTSDGKSQLRQDFDVTGFNELTISFNWAVNYWDSSSSANDTFLSLVREDRRGTIDQPLQRITMLNLSTNGTFFNRQGGIAYGHYTQTIDISNFVTDDARLIFRLIEESSCLGSTASIAGIDNVSVTAPAPVPEPSTILLMGAGLLGLVGYNRKRLIKKS